VTKLTEEIGFETVFDRSCQKIIQFENKEKKKASKTNEKK